MGKDDDRSGSDIRRTALIVAAGNGSRAGRALPKQFREYQGKPLLRHSVEHFMQSGYFQQYIVVIGTGQDKHAAKALAGLDDVTLAYGGETRQQSVHSGLKKAAFIGMPDHIFIHDAARPNIPSHVIARLIKALEHAVAAVPVLPVTDSISFGEENILQSSLDRDRVWRVQTPQAFDFSTVLDAHHAVADRETPTDDARVVQAAGHEVVMVEGSQDLHKITFSEDFEENSPTTPTFPRVRTGLGFDVHRLVAGEQLWLGGIEIAHDKGLSGHSDADVALHAITDAILGAVAAGDIGDHFPPDNDKWKGQRSDAFLSFAAKLARGQGYRINHIDLTIICEAPKIGPHRKAMRSEIAKILDLDLSSISVKATTTERLGATGRGEGIAAQAIATLSK